MVKKFPLKELDLNKKETYLVILEFLNVTGKIPKFKKIPIFEHNMALNYSMVKKKLHMKRLDFNDKKLHLATLKFFNLVGGKLLNFGKSGFSNLIQLQITLQCKKISHE